MKRVSTVYLSLNRTRGGPIFGSGRRCFCLPIASSKRLAGSIWRAPYRAKVRPVSLRRFGSSFPWGMLGSRYRVGLYGLVQETGDTEGSNRLLEI